jgi:hypothetical protein
MPLHAFAARATASAKPLSFIPRQIQLAHVAGYHGLALPKPMRVKNIFICSGVVFCASSKMMKA